MRELLGVLMAVTLVTVGVTAGQDRIRDWAAARAAAGAGASMGLFVAAARDYLDSRYVAVAARLPAIGAVVHVAPDELRAAGLLPAAWRDAGGGGGQRHVLAIRRTAADSLTALAYTYGGRPLGERAMILAAKGGPVGLGVMSAEFGAAVTAIGHDWQVRRADYNTDARFPIEDSPAGDGRLAAVLFAHRGRVLGPWLCRAEVPARPECNEMTAALTIAPASLVSPDAAALEVAFPSGRALAVTGAARFDGDVGIGQAPADGTALSVAGAAAVDGELRVAATIRARNYVQTSDPRAKTGLETVSCTPALRRRLAGLRPHRWTWKDGGGPGLGYNADQVAAAFPELTSRGPGGFRQIDPIALAILKQECGAAAAPRRSCPGGRFRLLHWGPIPAVVPRRPVGGAAELPGPARGFLECPRVRATCAADAAAAPAGLPDHGDGWRFACVPAAGLALRTEPAIRLATQQE